MWGMIITGADRATVVDSADTRMGKVDAIRNKGSTHMRDPKRCIRLVLQEGCIEISCSYASLTIKSNDP